MNRLPRLCFVVAFVFAPLAAHAQGGPGGPPPNYQQLVSQLATLTAQVATLQGQVATLQGQVGKLEGDIVSSDLAGTYAFTGFGTTMRGLHAGPPLEDATISTDSFRATLTLNADGTGQTSDGACSGSTLNPRTGDMHGFDCSGEPASDVTWTYEDGIITITFDDGDQIPMDVALGGRLLTVAFSPFHPSDPSSNHVLLFATRLK
jgi:hypothetical protein